MYHFYSFYIYLYYFFLFLFLDIINKYTFACYIQRWIDIGIGIEIGVAKIATKNDNINNSHEWEKK